MLPLKNAKIPRDYKIIGYDNILFSKIFYPELTIINTDIDQLSMEALDFLVRRIRSGKTDSTANKR